MDPIDTPQFVGSEDLWKDYDKWGKTNRLKNIIIPDDSKDGYNATIKLINYLNVNERTFLDIESLLKNIIYLEVII